MINGADILANFEKTVWHMDEPNPNATHVPTYLLAKEAKKDVAVVLGGDGGDEIFGGYPRYYYSMLLDKYQLLPEFLRKNILPVFLERFLKKENLGYKLNVPRSIDRYLLFMSEHDETLREVLRPSVSSINPEFFLNYFPQNKFKDFSKYLMYLDLTMWLADESLMRSDKMTMAHGLEERVPILDHRLIELAFKIPTKLKIGRGNNNKMIFRKAMASYLPKEVLNKDKRGWFSPGSYWLRSGLKDFSHEVLSPSYCKDTREYFDFSAIQKMLDEHISGKRYNAHTLWSLLTFQVWYKKFLT
jgi:asparagine synthase (glutamine-hydrolysing)